MRSIRLILILIFSSGIFFLKSETDPLKPLFDRLRDAVSAGKDDSILVYADQVLKEADRSGSNPDYYRLRALSNKASACARLNRTKEAIDLFYQALKLCKDTSSLKIEAYIYNQLGSINYDQKNTALAKSCFRQEVRLKRNSNDRKGFAGSLLNLSAVYRSMREYDSSAMVLKEFQKIVGDKIDESTKGHYYNALAVQFHSYYKRDSLRWQLDSAVTNYERSLSVWLKLGDLREAFRPLFNIGGVYHARGEYVKALGYYQRALELTSRLNLFREKMTIYGNMAEAYNDLHDYKQSTDYFRKYIEIKDTVQNQELKDYSLRLDRQFKDEQNKILIQQQQLQIAEKNLKIEQQGKRIYLSLLIALVLLAVAVFVMIRFNFQKRLNEKTEEAKKKFFSNVVHEIRTPLSMIQAPLNVLKTRVSSADDRNNIDMAERNIQRLNELVNQMLDMSKIDAVKYNLNETFGDLEVFFNDILSNYKKLAGDKQISFVDHYNLQQRLAFFDKDALEKVTGNLLSNAIKYTSGGQRIGIDVDTEETEQGLKLTISVWDTGVGISEKDQEKIFSRFYRSEKTAGSAKGVGIGLALVKDLVDLQKGTIQLKSKEGKGSTFTVMLPLRTKEEAAKSEAPAIDDNAPLILIAEDDADILEFNSTYLEQNNFRVLKARNGREALLLIEKTLPDLILSDLMMPELDGLGLLRAVRSNPESDHIPVIMLSAKAAAESRMEALKTGVQGYLVKPFLPEELLSLVRNQIEILGKKKTEFKEQIGQPEKRPEEKFTGSEPYTQKLFALIFKQLDDPELSVEKLADQMATNRSHFQRKVKTITGLSPSEIVRTIRLEKAKELLLAKSGNITEVAYQTGFSSQSYFTKCFTQHFGLSPTQMLQQQK